MPYKIVFTEFLLEKLKDKHGPTLIPLIHKLHEKYIYLSSHLTSFINDISEQVFENKKVLGKFLLNYVLFLSRQGAMEEANYNCELSI